MSADTDRSEEPQEYCDDSYAVGIRGPRKVSHDVYESEKSPKIGQKTNDAFEDQSPVENTYEMYPSSVND